MVNNYLYAQDNSNKQKIIKKNEPIEISYDRMEAFHEKKMVVFSGNATAIQGDVVLVSDQLFFYYKNEQDKKDKIGTKEIETSGELDKIEAKGNVVITQKERLATSEEASFNQESGQIIMTGNAYLREGKNTIRGCKIIVYTNEERASVVPCTSGKNERVKAVIYPQKNKESKGKI
jgi:lipopolysaccharide export system protein LptA